MIRDSLTKELAAVATERDQWREVAEKLAGALRGWLGPTLKSGGKLGCDDVALAAFDRLKKDAK
jgi:hypothetical protein